jgi:hypothetical protein
MPHEAEQAEEGQRDRAGGGGEPHVGEQAHVEHRLRDVRECAVEGLRREGRAEVVNSTSILILGVAISIEASHASLSLLVWAVATCFFVLSWSMRPQWWSRSHRR